MINNLENLSPSQPIRLIQFPDKIFSSEIASFRMLESHYRVL